MDSTLSLEALEIRLLPAAPIAPFDLDLLAGGDSGTSSTDDITNLNNGTVQLIAEENSTVEIFNAGYLGDAVGQGDTLFYDGGDIIIEGEKGTVAGALVVDNSTGGFQGTGYIEETAATPGDPSTGGTADYNFYIDTANTYYVHARVYYPDGSSNSIFVNIDDQWDVGENGPSFWSTTYASWHMNTAKTIANGGVDQSWALGVGWHSLEIHGRETGALLDRLIISTNAAAPVDPGGAESLTFETYQYTFAAGDLIGSSYGTANSITATAENIDGTSPVSTALAITYDNNTVTPAAPVLDSASDTGSSNSDRITNDTTATITGAAGSVEPDSTIWLRVGAVNTRSSTANADGSWSVSLQNGDLAVGANTIDIIYIDPAGNTSTDSSNISVTLDTAVADPALPDLAAVNDSGFSNTDNITSESRPLIQGAVATVENNSTVQIWLDTPSGPDTQIASVTAAANGSWSYYFTSANPLEEGNNDIHIVAVDPAGNVSNDSVDLTITLDTTAAAAVAAPDLDAAADSGSSNSDDITGNLTPVFTGPAGSTEANATVWIRVDGVNVRSDTANVDGSYSVTLQIGDIAAGSHTIDMVYVDAADNTSTDSPDLTVTIDTAAAAPVAAPDLDSASDSGDSDSDDQTNDTTATFTGPAGSVEANATVWLRVGTVNTRSSTANADGSYSVSLQNGDLAEGANAIDLLYIDSAGNTSLDSPDLTVMLDTTVADPAQPDLTDASDTGTNSSDDITADTRPTIQGLAGAVEANSTLQIWLDTPTTADTQVDTATAAADGSWSYAFTSASPLEDGVNLIHVVAVDPAGNVSNDSVDLSVTIDFSTGAEDAPDLEVASDTGLVNNDNITADTTATISGFSPPGAQIKIRTNESTIVTFTDDDPTDGNPVPGAWSYTYGAGVLIEGANTIDFLTIDTNNNASDWSLDLVVTLDTTVEQPTLPMLNTADDSGTNSGDDLTNVTTPTISGTSEANSTVTIDINAASHIDTTTAAADGTWSYTLTNGWLNEGVNTIFATATDIAGNTSVASSNLIITLDTTVNAPSLPDLTAATDTGASSTDNTTSHANPRITGTADPNTTITVRLDPAGAATVLGTTTADGAGNWNYTFAANALAEGANVIDVTSTDNAANTIESADLTITIETAISDPTALDLINASDLGDSNSDDLTSLTTATITGVADPANTIYVRVNGTDVGSTTSDGGGNWSYSFDGVDDLVEGINIIDAYAEDGVGNVSGFSTDLIVTLDTTVAVPFTPDLTLATDSGSSNTDDYTNDATATISGTSEPGATILIHLNSNDNFDTTVDVDLDGNWTYTFAAGLNGSVNGTANTIKAAQRDPAGNLSAFSNTLTVTLDNTAELPTLPDLLAVNDSGDSNSDDLTNQSTVKVSGTIEVNSSLQIFNDSGGGAVLVDTISESLVASGNWSYTFTQGQLTEGANQITVIATDKAGNVSAGSAALTITLDTTIAQPTVPDLSTASDTGDFNNDEVTSDETPTFSGTTVPNAHVSIRVDGEPINTVNADGAGNWTYTFVLGEIQTGVRQVDVVVTDTAGNVSVPSDDLTIWLNVVPTQPAAPNLLAGSDSGSIATDDLTLNTAPVIDGRASPNVRVMVFDDNNYIGDTNTDANGFWQYTFADGILAEGLNVIIIQTEDSSGLLSAFSLPLNLTLDTNAPIANLPDLVAGSDTGIIDSDNLTSDETATIEGTTEPSALVDIYHNTQLLTQLTAATTGNWSYTFAPGVMVIGDNDIYIIVTDVAGNVSAASATLTVVLDVQNDTPGAPDLDNDSDSGLLDNDELTNTTTPTISGTVKELSSVDILVSGAVVATVNADANGDWSYTFTSNQLTEGVNLIETISTDPVGNTARSAALSLALDTQGPILYNYFPRDIYTQTTNLIELFINGDDLNTIASTDPTGYVLQGAGGDGIFDNGNDWIIPISNISVDLITGLVQLNSFITLSDDAYRLTIDPNLALLDEAGNPSSISLLTNQTNPPQITAQPLVLHFEIDTAGPPAPTIPQLAAESDSGLAGDLVTNIAAPIISVTADADLAVEIISNGRSVGFANEITAGQYQLFVDPSFIREGENLILARGFDGLGNSSDLSPLLSFVYDSQPPQVADIIVDPLWLNTGPTQISVVFNETDINPATINNLAQYQLLASGGDETFGDGNEVAIDIESISFQADTHTIVLGLPQTATGASELTDETYQLTILGDGGISDVAGNVMDQSVSTEFTVVPATDIHNGERFRFSTDTGSVVTVTLLGQGDAEILLGGDIGSDNLIEKIVVTNSDANTRLKIISSKTSEIITIGQILADNPLRAIMASQVNITQSVIVDDGINRLSLSRIADDTLIDLSTNDPLNIDVKTIGSDVQFAIDGELSQLLIKDSGFDGVLNVSAGLGKLKVAQALSATVTAQSIERIQSETLTGATIRSATTIDQIKSVSGTANLISAATSLNQIRFVESLTASTVAAGSNITQIRINADAVDNLFLAGADLGSDAALNGIDDQFSNGNIAKLYVKGSFVGSVASAAVNPGVDLTYFTADDTGASQGHIEKVNLGTNSLNHLPTDDPYGLIAHGTISPFKVGNVLFEAPLQDGPFRLMIP